MKKIAFLLLIMLVLTNIQAQNDEITLSFSAEQDGNSLEIDSVLIENLSQGGSMVIYDDYVNLESTSTSISDVIHNDLYVSQNYPNPFREKTNINIYVPKKDEFVLDVYDLTGRKLTSYETNLEQGNHQFTFHACNQQSYILTVNSNKYKQQRLMIQIGEGSRSSAEITYRGTSIQNKKQQAKSGNDFPYELGDMLRYTGYVSGEFENLGHDVITDAPTSNKVYIFDISFPLYALSLNVEPSSGGNVDGVGEYEEGETVKITATANEGWEFVNWTGDTDYIDYTDEANASVTIPAYDISLTANFKEEEINKPTVTTANITNITENSATGGGNVTDDGGATVTARGICYSTSQNPTTSDNTVSSGSGTGSFEADMIGLDPTTTYYARAYATNSEGTAYGEQISFKTHLEDGPGDGVTDIDGNTYSTVIIGNQEWMAENLRVTQYNNGDAIPTGLSDTDWENTTDGAYAIYPHGSISGLESEAEVVEAYGKLYNWYAVDDLRGLCPTGWRVPSDTEWTELIDYVVDQGYPNEMNNPDGAGNALKSCRQVDHPEGGECATSEHPRWSSHSTHSGFDEFGFSALPGGGRTGEGTFFGKGFYGSWWSFTEYSSSRAWRRYLYYDTGYVIRYTGDKSLGCSVRCVRDL